MTDAVLVVGYGNALRSDDGIGWHVADRLFDDHRFADLTVLRLHQLTPELSLDFSRADLVVLVDASHDPAPGTFTVEQIVRAEHGATTWSHHLSPPALIALAGELYGHEPDVFLVSVGIESVEVGESLSPVVDATLPKVIDAVAQIVSTHGRESRSDQVVANRA